jgi:hypothetical protein
VLKSHWHCHCHWQLQHSALRPSNNCMPWLRFSCILQRNVSQPEPLAAPLPVALLLLFHIPPLRISLALAVPLLHAAIALVRKIRYFKSDCRSESKFHVTVGHATTLATAVFFGARELAVRHAASTHSSGIGGGARPSSVGAAREVLISSEPSDASGTAQATGSSDTPPDWDYDWAQQHLWQDVLVGKQKHHRPAAAVTDAPAAAGTGGAPAPPLALEENDEALSEWQWCALLFEAPLLCPARSRLIASHLDADVHTTTCRLVFYGRIVEPLPSADLHELRRCNIYKEKTKRGVVDRLEEGSSAGGVSLVGKSLFKKETDMSIFMGLRVHTRAGQSGAIVASFGKGGKFKAHFPTPEVVDPQLVESAPDAAAAGAPGPSARISERSRRAVASVGGAEAALEVPPIRPGDPIFMRYRKRMFEPRITDGPGKPVHRLLQS